jgi:CheY-like chemotaxis protein
LNGILALAELLAASDLPKRERDWAEAIRGTSNHLAQLTTLVVDAAKAGSTGLVLRDEPFAPRELAESVAASLAARAHAKTLAVDFDIAGRWPERLRGDAVRLRSALENLIDNAVKFTERGEIAFSASVAKAGKGRVRLTFTVADSGMGITAADLKRLFRPFAQASEDVARRYGGAGLGLVFVKRIAKAMGGNLDVTSKPGRGSAFRLTVTVKDVAPEAGQRPGKVKTVSGLRVLCVEDNPYGRMVHATVLRELGHRVTFTGSGEAALELAAGGEHDVVVMDIELPGINGIETTRRIRALPPPAGAIAIIGVSGRSEPKDEAAAKAAGMSAYLRKPATPAELNGALQAATKLRRA